MKKSTFGWTQIHNYPNQRLEAIASLRVIRNVGHLNVSTENEIIFSRTYKDFIYYFNMLERNIGSSLNYCLSQMGKGNPKKWLSASFDSRIKKIMRLAKTVGVDSSFSKWNSEIQNCRKLRNIITHGSWEWREFLKKPIQYHAPEIADGKGEFTTEEFSEQLIFLQQVSDTCLEIRKILETACEKKDQPAVSPYRFAHPHP